MLTAYTQFLVEKGLQHNLDSLEDFSISNCVCCGKLLQHTDNPIDSNNALYKEYLEEEELLDSLEIRSQWTKDNAADQCLHCGEYLDCINLEEFFNNNLSNFTK